MVKFIKRICRNQYFFPLFLAGFLSVYRINEKSLWLDEALTIRIASLGWGAMWQVLMTTEPYRWLYYVLLHIWMRFGSGEIYYRLLSVIFALTAIPGMYLLGKSVRSPKVGTISACLLAIHPMFLRYAQEVHSYSLLLSLSIWSSYLFMLCMHRPSVRRMVVYVLCALLMVYSHSFGVFVLASHYVSLLYTRRFVSVTRLYSVSIIALLLGLLPFLLFPVPYQNIAWIQYPDRAEIMNFVLLLSGGHIVLFMGFVSLLVYSLLSTHAEGGINYTKDRAFFIIWLLLPVVASLAISYVLRPVFVPRYMVIVLPALLVLVGDSLSRLSKMKAIVVLIGFGIVMAASSLYWHTGLPVYARLGFTTFTDKEDWRGAAEYIRDHSHAPDEIIFYPYFVRFPFEYYWNQFNQKNIAKISEISSAPYTIGGVMPDPNMSRIQELSTSSGRIWLVLSHNLNSSLGRDRQASDIMHKLESLYAHEEKIDYTGITVIVYY